METSVEIGLPYDFAHIIMICKVYVMRSLKQRKKDKKLKERGEEAPVKLTEIYANVEEEVFAKVWCAFNLLDNLFNSVGNTF